MGVFSFTSDLDEGDHSRCFIDVIEASLKNYQQNKQTSVLSGCNVIFWQHVLSKLVQSILFCFTSTSSQEAFSQAFLAPVGGFRRSWLGCEHIRHLV